MDKDCIQIKQTDRSVFIDYLRVLAILCVVICHSVEIVYTYDTEYLKQQSELSSLFRIAAIAFGRSFGVPVFLMITGYLLLSRTYGESSIKKFYKNKCVHIIVVTMIWVLIYALFYKLILKTDLSIGELIKELFFLRNASAGHLWYLPLIIGLYLMIPFISKVFNDEVLVKFVAVPYLLVLISCFILPFLRYSGIINDLEPQISIDFTGGYFGLYLVTGCLINKGFLKKISSTILIMLLILCVSFNIAFAFINFREAYFVFWYDSPFIFMASVALFELISRNRSIKLNKPIVFMAKYSFAVYLVHFFFIKTQMLKDLFKCFALPLQVVFMFIIVTVISICAAWLISKIPKIGKYIFYINK